MKPYKIINATPINKNKTKIIHDTNLYNTKKSSVQYNSKKNFDQNQLATGHVNCLEFTTNIKIQFLLNSIPTYEKETL